MCARGHSRCGSGAAVVRSGLEVLTAPETGESADVAGRRLNDALARVGLDAIDGTVLEGCPDTALADASATLDLLIVGSRSYGPLRAVLLGAVTRRLIPVAHCPVMVVPRVPSAAEEVVLVGGMEALAPY
jgi:nucleotide-binding universal stress UspA family protein